MEEVFFYPYSCNRPQLLCCACNGREFSRSSGVLARFQLRVGSSRRGEDMPDVRVVFRACRVSMHAIATLCTCSVAAAVEGGSIVLLRGQRSWKLAQLS